MNQFKTSAFLFILVFMIGCSQKSTIREDKVASWQLKIADKQNKNIYDYYLLLPNAFFDCETEKIFGETERKEKIKLLDVKNGYIEFDGNFTIALFKDAKQKRDYIAISNNSSGRGTTCGGYNLIMEFLPDRLAWKDRLDLFPSEAEEKPYFDKFYADSIELNPYLKLPQVGLVVALKDEFFDKNVYEMKWNGSRFEIIK